MLLFKNHYELWDQLLCLNFIRFAENILTTNLLAFVVNELNYCVILIEIDRAKRKQKNQRAILSSDFSFSFLFQIGSRVIDNVASIGLCHFTAWWAFNEKSKKLKIVITCVSRSSADLFCCVKCNYFCFR